MRQAWILTAVILALCLPHVASGQRTSDQTLNVTANNIGIFSCTLSTAAFDFGTVDANGTDFGTANVTANGRNGADTGGLYESNSGAVTWICQAAPPSSVDISLQSTAADHTTGSMDDNDLEIRIPDVGGGTSSGYQFFTSQSDLITGMSVGNGANEVSGGVDLRLTVLDTDPLGANTWVVKLRATGNP